MNFNVKVINHQGQITFVDVVATTREQAQELAQRDGFKVLSIQVSRAFKWPEFKLSQNFMLSVFSKELLALLNAGMSQVESLETLIDEKSSQDTKRMLKDILNTLYEGRTLSKALESYPDHFPKLYVELIRASEKTGSITDTISEYIKYQEKIDTLRKKVINTSIYPAILMISGFLVFSFLMFYVVPKFSEIYQDMGRDLPFFSRMLMEWGAWLGENSALFLTFFTGLVILMVRQMRKHGFLSSILQLFSKIPMVGEQVRVHQLALFYRTISILLKAGINIVPAMVLLEGILKTDMLHSERKARQAISEGKSVSVSMQDAGLTTPVGYKLLRVGEKTGNLDELTEHIADFYDEDVSRWLDWFTRLFEPLLMAVIGIVIGGIVVVMYFPIFDIAGNLQ
ncbi:type II secretion system F family protein [Limnohabitans sp. Jir72]|uniref:type II secretion system F family protein n=1 Tax=Limnohabitans sp. Jir72 TaxID=1977909 RepID=UPI000D37B365|nr:type II secretion system F family protein [Limnohabitans sp. Jir72]PUE31363.1 hypothetical protein B9Z52_10695 [Limnohabitans sp. Jir72]